jgi:ADP-ribose pyrophosphatase YjhB (NUDIX family)
MPKPTTPNLAVDMIIEYKGKLVLIQRKNPPYGHALPGGFVDVGETVEQAAKREAKEETNLDIYELKQFHVYSDPKRDKRGHTVSLVFIAKGKGTLKAGDDAKSARFVAKDNLPELVFDHDKIIEDYLDERY